MGDIAEFYDDHCDEHDLPPETHCKYCNKKDLQWDMTPAGWRLFNHDGTLHNCIDPFELVRRIEHAGNPKSNTRSHVRVSKRAK